MSSARRIGERGQILALILGAALLVGECRVGSRSGPVEGYLLELGDHVAEASDEASAHAEALLERAAGATSVEAAEGAYEASIDERIAEMMRDVAAIELCMEEGESKAAPWIAELLGRLKAEVASHGAAMRSAADEPDAANEERRHKRAMASLLDALGEHVDTARAAEQKRRSRKRDCPQPTARVGNDQ